MPEIPSKAAESAQSLEDLRRRLGEPDMVQLRLLLSVPPAQRIRVMLGIRDVVVNTWMARLRRTHPHLSDLERCQLMFKWLQKNG